MFAGEDVTAVYPADRGSASADESPLQFSPGTVVDGRYRIVSLLGRGGVADVYRAEDLKLGQNIALKFLRDSAVMLHTRALYDEVRIGRQLAHPNICRLYDIRETSGRVFLTMQFVDGEDLSSLLHRIGRLPMQKAIGVARDICSALSAAHAQGYVHRDLKPGNIIIDSCGRARITDFGLAVANGETPQFARAGTPGYMAPEQLLGRDSTTRSDIYALGAVLYEVFTGCRAFAPGTLGTLLEQQKAMRVVPPSMLVPEMGPRLEHVILRCLTPDPEDRPQSVDEVMRELPKLAASGETSPRLAWSLLAMTMAGIAGVMLLAPYTLLSHTVQAKAPEVLVARAERVLAIAGVNEAPADTAIAYTNDVDRRTMSFVYRRSAGMATVIFDANGNLSEMTVVPRDATNVVPFEEWSSLIAFTGIDAASLREIGAVRNAPVESDEKRAWITRDGKELITAASLHGAAVWLFVSDGRSAVAPSDQAAWLTTAETAMTVLLPLIAAIIAFHNLRAGRGDWRSAMRVALVTVVCVIAVTLFEAHHVAAAAIGRAVFWGVGVWAVYVVVEPFVRRRWPSILIGWTRLISGRFTDRLIGREILLGTGIAAMCTFAMRAAVMVPKLWGAEITPVAVPPMTLVSSRYVNALLVSSIGVAVLRTMLVFALMLVFTAVSKRWAIYATIAATAIWVIGYTAGPMPIRILCALLASATYCLALVRFGMLAAMAAGYVFDILLRTPLTLDVQSWYFGRSMFAMSCLAALALYGFMVVRRGAVASASDRADSRRGSR